MLRARLGEKLYNACDLVMRVAIVNALWVGFTFLGFGLFGVGPATVALFSITRKWIILKERDFSTSKEFYYQYKKNFLRGNCLTSIFLGVGAVLFTVLRFYQLNPNPVHNILVYIMLLLMLVCILVSFYVFPLFVHYETTFKQLFKNAFVFTFANPIQSVLMVAVSLVIYTIGENAPGILLFFGVGMLGYNITWLANFAIENVEKAVN